MGYFNVVKPCVVGKLHYATVPAQPIEVDDDVAAPLVESGCLAAYQPGERTELMEVPGLVEVSHDSGATWEPEGVTGEPMDDEPPTNPPPPRARGPRRPKD